MAFLGVKVDEQTAKQLKLINVPGIKEDSSGYHITILYLGENVKLDKICDAIRATYKVCERFKPFEVCYDTLACFPKGEDGVPIILKIDCKELMELNKKLRKSFDKHDVGYSKKFDYNPHTTLAYSDREIKTKSIKPVKMNVSQLVLWAGDNMDEKLSVNFSLGLKKDALEEKINNFEKIAKI